MKLKFRAFQDNKILHQLESGVYGTKRFLDNLYEDCELMQFTGLKDKNGNEIFDGDIVLNSNRGRLTDEGKVENFVVKDGSDYKDWGCPTGFYMESIEKVNGQGQDQSAFINTRDHLNNTYEYCIEIIGNIHENPELLNAD